MQAIVIILLCLAALQIVILTLFTGSKREFQCHKHVKNIDVIKHCASVQCENLCSISEILPHVYIGNKFSAMNRELLKRYNIHAIVNCTTDLQNEFENDKELQINYIRIPLNDTPLDQATFLSHINCTIQFIRHNVIANKNTLVHCHAGVSRSASVVVAYIMKYYGYDVDKAITYVINKRSIVFHKGAYVVYMPALKQFQKSLTSCSSYRF